MLFLNNQVSVGGTSRCYYFHYVRIYWIYSDTYKVININLVGKDEIHVKGRTIYFTQKLVAIKTNFQVSAIKSILLIIREKQLGLGKILKVDK